MSTVFRPGRIGLAVLSAVLCAVYGAPLVSGARLERRAARLRAELAAELGPLDARLRVAPPWQERWERGTAQLDDWLARGPERSFAISPAGPAATDGSDERRSRWARELREASPELEAILHELAALEPAAITPLTRSARLLPVREWQNAVLVEARDAARGGQPERALSGLADALRLARAADSGTLFGGLLRTGLERGALDVGLAMAQRGELEPRALAALLHAQLDDGGTWRADWRERLQVELSGSLAAVERAPDERRRAALAVWIEQAEASAQALARDRGLAGPPAAGGDGESPPNTWQGCLQSFGEHRARRNAALTALALVAEHRRAGRWPARLAGLPGLEPADTLDPATGAPLPWRVEPADATTQRAGAPAPPAGRLVVGPSTLSEHAFVAFALAP